MTKGRVLKVCPLGHRYYRSSDCPVCPVCEAKKKEENTLFASLGAPARRALETKGINSAGKLALFSEKEILALHGMGPASMPALKAILKKEGLQFKK